MKNYCFSFTDYEVANLFTAVDCFLEYLDEYRYDLSNIQFECLRGLRGLFEGITLKYMGHSSSDSLPILFELREESDG